MLEISDRYFRGLAELRFSQWGRERKRYLREKISESKGADGLTVRDRGFLSPPPPPLVSYDRLNHLMQSSV